MSLLSNLIIFNKLLQSPHDAQWKKWSVWLEPFWVNGVLSPSLVAEYVEKHNIPVPEAFRKLLKTYDRKGVKDNLQLLPMEKPDLSMAPMTRIAQILWYFLMLYDFNAIQQLIKQRISNDEARTAVMSHLREVADFISTEKYSYTNVADHFIPIVKNYFVSALTHWKEWITPEDLGLGITEIIQLISESSGNPTDNPQSLYNQLMQNQLKWAEKSRCTDPGVKKGTKRLETNGSSDESPKKEPGENDKKITITEAAQKLGLSRQRIHQLIQKGVLRSVKDSHSNRIWIPEEDVLRIKDLKEILLPKGKILKRRNHTKNKENEKRES